MNEMKSHELVLQFFDSYRSTGVVDRNLLSDDFVYSGTSAMIDTVEWLHINGDEMPLQDAVILHIVSTDESAALMFEDFDLITLLTYRTAWFISFENGRISRLAEARQSLHRPPK